MKETRVKFLGVLACAAMVAACAGPQRVQQASPPEVVAEVPRAEPGSLMAEHVQTIEVMRARALSLYRHERSLGRAAMLKGSYYEAANCFGQAVAVVQANRTYFSKAEGDALIEAAQAQIARAEVEAETDAMRRAMTDERDLVLRTKRDAASAAARRSERVATLITQARELYDAARFREAEDILRQATIIDPQDENAALALRLVRSKIVAREYESMKHRAGAEATRQNLDGAGNLVPYTDAMVYPETWPATTRNRP